VRLVRESDPAFKSLDPIKEWIPEKCPEYRPPQKPSSKISKAIAPKDLLGWWTTVNLKGGCPEYWRFDKGGTGLIGVYSIACCEFEFEWRLSLSKEISLKLVSPEPEPPLDFFFSGTGSVAIEDRTDARGRHSRVLSIKPLKRRTVELLMHTEDLWKQWKEAWRSPKPSRSW